jgi:hypothetical protein
LVSYLELEDRAAAAAALAVVIAILIAAAVAAGIAAGIVVAGAFDKHPVSVAERSFQLSIRE